MATPAAEATNSDTNVEEESKGEVAADQDAGLMMTSGRRLDFFAAPYMLKLKLNQDLVPGNLSKENGGKDLIWQSTYGAYLCKLKKVNYGEFFTDIDAENQASLVVPITDKFEVLVDESGNLATDQVV